MRMPGKLMLSSVIMLAASGHAWSEDSLRQKLLDSGMPSALYSVDDHTTVFKTGADEDVGSKLEKICAEHEAAFNAGDGAYSCGGVFEASRLDSAAGQEQSFILKTADRQPLAYMNPSVPSLEELAPLPNGRIEGIHASIDIYQYMYALCKKENGTHSVVISKRFGKVARYTEVGAEEAFNYLLTSGDGKDPWFFACEGETKFLVEKDYQFNSDGANRFYFHPKRGLEWVDYVKAEDGKIARLDAR